MMLQWQKQELKPRQRKSCQFTHTPAKKFLSVHPTTGTFSVHAHSNTEKKWRREGEKAEETILPDYVTWSRGGRQQLQIVEATSSRPAARGGTEPAIPSVLHGGDAELAASQQIKQDERGGRWPEGW
jgi:hypothetical protein